MVIDFQDYKNRKEERQLVADIGFVPVKYESYCPFCQAPTTRIKTAGGTDVHTFDPTNMEAYAKLQAILKNVVDYFRASDQEVDDAALIEAFGEGMKDFLKEMDGGN